MSCQCKERGQATVAGIRALKSGDVKTAARQGRFIATSMVQDAKALTSRMAAAKLRLGRR